MNTTSRATASDQSTVAQTRPQTDAARRRHAARERALVLGGGGSTGNAWVIGVSAGLVDAGFTVTTADLIVGTSSGATAAAQIASAPPSEMLAAILAAASPPQGAVGTGRGGAPRARVVDHLQRTSEIISAAADAPDMRRRLGAASLELDAASDGSYSQRWRQTVAARLPGSCWPDQRLLIPAVAARTGEPVVFDGDSGIDLVDAVAASTSSGLPYHIGDRFYIDGGYRRNENADLAAGYARVLVLSPLGGRSRYPLDWGIQLSAQVDGLRAGGSKVVTVCPESDAEHMFGADAMDLSLRPPAARAGYVQGQALGPSLIEFWR